MTQRHPADSLVARLADSEGLDNGVEALRSLAGRLLQDRRVDDLLSGRWLGHPVHPALTDLPIGFWTSAFVLDLTGGRNRRAADVLVGLGLASALPTMAAGLADWRHRDRRDQRIGVAHAAANGSAWLLYAVSLAHRARGQRVRGVLFGLAGATAATAGGFLGGQLAFGETPGSAQDAAHPAELAGAAEGAGVVDQQDAALAAMVANGQ